MASIAACLVGLVPKDLNILLGIDMVVPEAVLCSSFNSSAGLYFFRLGQTYQNREQG